MSFLEAHIKFTCPDELLARPTAAQVRALGRTFVPVNGDLVFRNPETGATIRRVNDNGQWWWEPYTGAVRLGGSWAGDVSANLRVMLRGSRGTIKLDPDVLYGVGSEPEPNPNESPADEAFDGHTLRMLAGAGNVEGMRPFFARDGCGNAVINDPFPTHLSGDPSTWSPREHSALGRHTALMYAAQHKRPACICAMY